MNRMIAMLDTHSADYLHIVAMRTATILHPALVGTYLHGSAVLGGFAPTRSDLDLLTVTAGPLDAPTKQQLATALAPQALPCPAVRGLELSVVTRTTTLAPLPAPPFELHLATSNQTTRMVDGHGHPGDPDLVLHFAVCRDHGHPLAGPPPRQVFAPIPRRWLLQGLARELTWAQHHAPVDYQVLNACRAWRFAQENLLCSKLDGGQWARSRLDDPAVIELAIARQQGQPAQPPSESAVTAFVQDILQRLHDQLAEAQPPDEPHP
jgi:hypothetical protein